nr:hypothetical protein [Morganella morganii]
MKKVLLLFILFSFQIIAAPLTPSDIDALKKKTGKGSRKHCCIHESDRKNWSADDA